MKNLRKLALALTLALIFAGSTFAGETSTPPCAQPVPGETSTPPCDGGSNFSSGSNDTTSALTESSAGDLIAVDAFVSAVETMLLIF